MTSGGDNFNDCPQYLTQYLTILCTSDAPPTISAWFSVPFTIQWQLQN